MSKITQNSGKFVWGFIRPTIFYCRECNSVEVTYIPGGMACIRCGSRNLSEFEYRLKGPEPIDDSNEQMEVLNGNRVG